MIYDIMGTIVYYILFKSVVVCILEISVRVPEELEDSINSNLPLFRCLQEQH